MTKRASLTIVADGLHRLLRDPDYRRKQALTEQKIRQKYATELSAASDYRERIAVEDKIRREIKQSKPSPYSLWSSV